MKLTEAEAKRLGIPGAKGGNKYGAVKKEYRGVIYDSTLEANVAAELDKYKRLGLVTRWERQTTYTLEGGVTYRADFEVWYVKGLYRVLDAKGVVGLHFKDKAKLFRAQFGFPIDIVKHWKDTPQEGR